MTYLDHDIQKDIVAELEWEPSLRNDDIAVGVREGVVTLGGFVDAVLSGTVRSFAEMKDVKRAARTRRGSPRS